MFSLQGGASSCKWEIRTAHLTSPYMRADYIGPEHVPHDHGALFVITVGQAINYYDSGVDGWGEKARPGWVAMDAGYM